MNPILRRDSQLLWNSPLNRNRSQHAPRPAIDHSISTKNVPLVTRTVQTKGTAYGEFTVPFSYVIWSIYYDATGHIRHSNHNSFNRTRPFGDSIVPVVYILTGSARPAESLAVDREGWQDRNTLVA